MDRADPQGRTDELWRFNARAVVAEVERLAGSEPPQIVLADVLDMTVRAGVDTVVLDEERAAGRSVRPADHPFLPLPDGVPAAPAVRSDLLVLAAAAATGAEAVFTAPSLLPDDGVALLRWDRPAPG